MLQRFKTLFAADVPQSRRPDDGEALRLAAAVLLVEAARMDGVVDGDEERTIRDLLVRRFELDDAAVSTLVAEANAEADEAVELSTYVRTIRDHFDHGQRVELVEMLWSVVYADRVLDDFEANLMRRVAGLLYVTDQESGAARQRARERLDLGGDTE